MKPGPFAYHAPTTVAETLQLMASLPDSKLLAGGQTLMPMMNFRFLSPENIIDINRVPELAGIAIEGDRLVIGAMTRQRDIELSAVVRERAPLLVEAYQLVSHRQIRNRGTLGGSLCQLDPASEQPCFTSVMDGILTASRLAEGAVQRRQIPIAEWPAMYLTPALEEGEMLERISLRLWPPGHGYAFEEYARRHGDYALAGVAVLCTMDRARRIEQLAISLCGVGPGPVRLSEVEAQLRGRPANEAAIEQAGNAASQIEVMSDANVTAEYRRHLCGELTRRALRRAFERAQPIQENR